jgi:hypothetical protein
MAKKMRFCFYCGAEMGEIEDRYYQRNDPCGAPACNRFAREEEQAERDEAHRRVDEDFDGRW